jgi:hypothetical protein
MRYRYLKEVTAAGMAAFAIAWGFGAAVQAQDAEFVGNSTCKVCHNKAAEGEQWKKWSAEKHSQAFKTLEGEEANKIAKEKGLTVPAAEAPECLKCHVTAYDAEKKAVPAKLKMAEGVQCETCHGASSEHVAAAKKAMLKKDEKVDLSATRVKPEEAICLTCHNPESPTWDPERYTKEDGTKAGFDFKAASEKIAHPNPKKAESAG